MKKSYMFLLIGLLVISLILVGCSKSTTSKTGKKALSGKAIFFKDWEACDQTPGCWEKLDLCMQPQNKNCWDLPPEKVAKCEETCLEYARGYQNIITKCPSGESALSFSGKHNYKLVGQFQIKCDKGSSSEVIGTKGTATFNFDCGNDPLTGLQGNYNNDLQMHQIKGFCGGNQGVNENSGEPNGNKFWDCGQTKGIIAVDFKIDPKGFINDINKIYCAGDDVPAESSFSWGMMKKVAAPSPIKTEKLCADGIDNDGDEYIDCHDSDCGPATGEVYKAGEPCTLENNKPTCCLDHSKSEATFYKGFNINTMCVGAGRYPVVNEEVCRLMAKKEGYTYKGTEKITATFTCGNNKQEGQEICDGTDLVGDSLCTDHSMDYIGGNVYCKSDCSAFDFSACVKKSLTKKTESWKVETNSKKLEMANNNITPSYMKGETIYDIADFLHKGDLKALEDGTYVTADKSKFDYAQYLYFKKQDNSNLVKYAESDDDITADFFFIKMGDQIAKYSLEFQKDAESLIYNSSGLADSNGKILEFFEDTKIQMMGEIFSLVKARRSTSKDVELTLMGGSESGILLEGKGKSYTMAGKAYQVDLVFMDSDEVQFKVNGQTTSKLKVGEMHKLKDGRYLGVSDILYQAYAGGVHRASFYLGAMNYVLKDNDITDSGYSTELTVNGESIDGANVIITGSDDNKKVKISMIQIEMIAQDNYYVGAGKKLSEVITSVGEEKEVLFTNNWDVEYKGLTQEKTNNITLYAPNNGRYNLVWYDGSDKQVDMPLAYTASKGFIQLSEGGSAFDKLLILKEDATIRKNDYFVVTGGDVIKGTAKSYALQYLGADKSSTTAPKIKFKNLGDGNTLEYSVNTVSGKDVTTIKLGGHSFKVENFSTKSAKDFTILVDLNGDTKIASTQIFIVDSYGAKITVGEYYPGRFMTTSESIPLIITTPNINDYDNQKPAVINLSLRGDQTGIITSTLGLDETLNPLLTPEGKVDIFYGYTSMGGEMTYRTLTGKPTLFRYSYPEKQRLPQLYVTAEYWS